MRRFHPPIVCAFRVSATRLRKALLSKPVSGCRICSEPSRPTSWVPRPFWMDQRSIPRHPPLEMTVRLASIPRPLRFGDGIKEFLFTSFSVPQGCHDLVVPYLEVILDRFRHRLLFVVRLDNHLYLDAEIVEGHLNHRALVLCRAADFLNRAIRVVAARLSLWQVALALRHRVFSSGWNHFMFKPSRQSSEPWHPSTTCPWTGKGTTASFIRSLGSVAAFVS